MHLKQLQSWFSNWHFDFFYTRVKSENCSVHRASADRGLVDRWSPVALLHHRSSKREGGKRTKTGLSGARARNCTFNRAMLQLKCCASEKEGKITILLVSLHRLIWEAVFSYWLCTAVQQAFMQLENWFHEVCSMQTQIWSTVLVTLSIKKIGCSSRFHAIIVFLQEFEFKI